MKGFIAITSVLIISAVILLLVVGASIPVFYARMDLLESEWKLQSQLWAKSCVELVALRRTAEPEYVGADAIALGDASCTVSAFRQKGSDTEFAVQVDYHGAVTTLLVELTLENVIVSEQEITSYTF